MADDRQVSYEEERRRREAEEPLDFSPSSTAVDPEHAAQDTSEHVQTGRHAYTENATFTEETMEAPSRQKEEAASAVSEYTDSEEHEHSEWLSLNQANRNFYASEDEKNTTTEQRKQDYANDTRAWGEQIGLTEYEIERAIQLVLDADPMSRDRYGTEVTILAALTISANMDTCSSDIAKTIRPHTVFADNNPEMVESYKNIKNGLGVKNKHVKECREELRSHL